MYLGFLWLWSRSPVTPLLAGGIELSLILIAVWLALSLLLRTSLWRAIASWLLTLVPQAAVVAAIYFVLVPYVLATYLMPTHGMARLVVYSLPY